MMFRRFTDLRRVHFVGIGGAGMSGIAEVLLNYDLEVSGSDIARSEVTRRLEEQGATVFEGHSPPQVHGADLVVRSSAVGYDNPEIAEAQRLGITVVRRAEMLGELMRLKFGIAIAGSHGKTTTTSLVGALLTHAEFDPTVIVGGRLRVSGTGARVGRSDYLVAEADEFDRSFLRLQPVIAVITNIDREHLDTYHDLEEIQDAFVDFADRVPFFGQAILCIDDIHCQEILPRLADHRVVTYGTSPEADLVAEEIRTDERGCRFVVRRAEQGVLGTVDLPMPGAHNIRNSLAAIAVGLAMGLEFAVIQQALASFAGVHRRFERLGRWRGAVVVDDYAHHPTEVAATLKAARQAFPRAGVHAVLQPHLYSRTRDMAEDFGRSLLAADHTVVTEVYGSREAPLPGITGELIVGAARSAGHLNVKFCPDWRDAPELLAPEVETGDVVLTLGAGDIYRLGLSLVEESH